MEPTETDEEFLCPVCMDTPDGVIHQCHAGHTCCDTCWQRVHAEDARCPQCRDPIPEKNVCMAAMRARDNMEVVCEHCQLVSTRKNIAAHTASCEERLVSCTASRSGCTWTGPQREQREHERECWRCGDQRVEETLQRSLDTMKRKYTEATDHATCLEKRLCALEERVRTTGDRMPCLRSSLLTPADSVIRGQGLLELLGNLREYVHDARVVATTCYYIGLQCVDSKQADVALDAGVLRATMTAMHTHSTDLAVQHRACEVLRNVSSSSRENDPTGRRKQAAADAGVLEAVVATLLRHQDNVDVQEDGTATLVNIVMVLNDPAHARAAQAEDVGAMGSFVAAMQAHPTQLRVQLQCCWGLCEMLRSVDSEPAAATAMRQVLERRAVALALGVPELATAARRAHTRGAVSLLTQQLEERVRVVLDALAPASSSGVA